MISHPSFMIDVRGISVIFARTLFKRLSSFFGGYEVLTENFGIHIIPLSSCLIPILLRELFQRQLSQYPLHLSDFPLLDSLTVE